MKVIVMDNGSTDRTRSIVRELGFNCLVVPKRSTSVHCGTRVLLGQKGTSSLLSMQMWR